MADPLSATASVVGILAFGLSSCKQILDFYESARGSRDDARALCESTEALAKILTLLQNLIDQPGGDSEATTAVREHIAACSAGLNCLKKKLDKIQNVGPDRGMRALYLAMQYPFREKTIMKLQNIVTQELMGHLSLALSALNLETSISITDTLASSQSLTNESISTLCDETRAIRSIAVEGHSSTNENISSLPTEIQGCFQQMDKDVAELAAISASIELASNRKEVLKWIAGSGLGGSSHNTARQQCQQGTGNWFLQGKVYQDWREEPGSFLWLHGIPGCGKTILCSSIIEETLAYCSTRENHHVAYFYISFNDGEKQRPENILRSLVSQLLWELSSLPDTLLDLYKRHKHKQPTIEVLLLALRFVMDMPGQTYIFIDALDECPARTGEREELLNALQSVKGYGIPTLHILLTSRREIDINERLTSVLTEPPFGIQNSEVDQDIRIHVRSEVRSNARLSKWPLIIQEEIETELVKGSHGMFRWVTCQLASLKNCLKASAVRKTLSSLPATLDATYERILLSIEPEYQQEAFSALIWLTASERPLTVEEVAEAAVVNAKGDPAFRPEDRLFDPKSILTVLSTLVSVTERPYWTKDAEIRWLDDEFKLSRPILTEISLAHYSVREYLTSERLSQGPASRFRMTATLAHQQISMSCLEYLCSKDIASEFKKIKETVDGAGSDVQLDVPWILPPLLPYACKYWPAHVRQCDQIMPDDVKRLILRFLQSEESETTWRALISPEDGNRFRVNRPWNYGISVIVGRPGPRAPPLYYAACLGLTPVVEALLESSPIDYGKGGILDTPLQAASFNGHEETVRILLRKGADVNASGGKFNSALQAASFSGHEQIVQHLLQAGAHVDIYLLLEEILRSPKPNPRIVARLLESATSPINQYNPFVSSTMRWAAVDGHPLIVTRLLEKMSDLRRTTYNWTLSGYSGQNYFHSSYQPNRTAPYEAAYAGNLEVLRLLIPRWTNIDEQDSYGRTALYWAAFHGHKEIVQLLVEHSANTHIRVMHYGWEARSWTYDRGQQGRDIQTLLDNACALSCSTCRPTESQSVTLAVRPSASAASDSLTPTQEIG